MMNGNITQDVNERHTITNIIPTNTKSYRRIGRSKIKQLPDNFFEKVLDLELHLKREFSMNTLQELVNLYSVIIIKLNNKIIFINKGCNRIL
jgi:hypothetical protein